MLANVMTLLLHRMKPNASAKALYPASLDTIVSILRRYAKMSDESAESGAMARGKRRARSVLWLHRRGQGGAQRTWTTRGHWVTLALDGASRYFDSLGAPPDPRLRRAASKALPSFTWVTELPDRLQTDVLVEEYLNDGSIGFLKSGEAFTSELGAKNTRFIARGERRTAGPSRSRIEPRAAGAGAIEAAGPAAPGTPRPRRELVVVRERGRGDEGGSDGDARRSRPSTAPPRPPSARRRARRARRRPDRLAPAGEARQPYALHEGAFSRA
eukprot:tig00000104_g4812.t1